MSNVTLNETTAALTNITTIPPDVASKGPLGFLDFDIFLVVVIGSGVLLLLILTCIIWLCCCQSKSSNSYDAEEGVTPSMVGDPRDSQDRSPPSSRNKPGPKLPKGMVIPPELRGVKPKYAPR